MAEYYIGAFYDQESAASQDFFSTDQVREAPYPALRRMKDYYSNGARIYVDIGDHIEYATAEDNSLTGCIANEIAGEYFVFNVLERARERGKIHDFLINKRVCDDQNTTWGYHESYLTHANQVRIDEAQLALLGVHLATRNIFVGAGAIRTVLDRKQFVISQKNFRLDHDFFNGTTGNFKPVVNLRNEALADATRYRRVHVTSGDPNMSPWATRMKLGTTSLVLRLIEEGRDLPDLRVYSLKALSSQVATDLSLGEAVKLRNGRSIRPREIQAQLYMAARELSEEVELPDDERAVLDMWEAACDDAATDPRLLVDRSDWVAKHIMLEHYRDKHGLAASHEELLKKDRQWDLIGAAGIGLKLRRNRWRSMMPSEALIRERMTLPPQDTRAAIRGDYIARFAGSPDHSADWESLTFPTGRRVRLADPYATTDEHYDELLAAELEQKSA